MATSAHSSSSSTTAPWRPLFLSHLDTLKSPEFVLSTVTPSPSSTSSTPYLPRARYCIFRGMFGTLPPNKHNTAERNPPVYDSDMLTFTTDVRMAKVTELFASSAGHGDSSQSQGSGGGGPYEAVFWVEPKMTQWRFRGTAYVLASDIEGGGEPGEAAESSGVRTAKSVLGARLRAREGEDAAAWSWRREVRAHFGNLSPGMRGSFKNPPPGTKVGEPVTGKGIALGQKVNENEDELAERNFRVVVLVVDDVEQLDLSVPDKARRWRFSYTGESGKGKVEEESEVGGGEKEGVKTLGEWKVEELWP